MGAREGGCERGVRLQFRLRVSRNYARRTTRHVSAPNNSCGGVEGQSEGERKKRKGEGERDERGGGTPTKIENVARTATSRAGATGYVYFPREYSALPNERAAESVRR